MMKRRPRVEDRSAINHKQSFSKRVRGRSAFLLALLALAALALWTPLSSGSGTRPAQPQSRGQEQSTKPAPSKSQKRSTAPAIRKAPQALPSLTTDRGFYLPGEEITLSGTNWSPGETVTIIIGEGAEAKKGVTLEATADEDGAFTITSPMPEIRAAIGEVRAAKTVRATTGAPPEENGGAFTASAVGSISRARVRAQFSAGEADRDGERLLEQEAFWLHRRTYPTGRFNPEWVRRAAEQDSRVRRNIPGGRKLSRQSLQLSPMALNPNGFTALGPQPERMTGCTGCFDYTTTAGRINDIKIDPVTPNVAYAASVGGGVWKTTNCCSSATTWSAVTDDAAISTTSIDTLAIDPNNHNTIYAGTGDLNYGSFSMGSQGILKSIDAGATWTVLGANVFGAALPVPVGQFPQYQAVGKVRVDPNDSNKVVAGTKRGLYLSYDGGQNWTGPCLTNSFGTQRQDITGLELTNISGTTRILAAIGVRGFATTVQFNLDQNGANGLYKGTMPASGCPTDFTSVASNANGFVYGAATSTYAAGANMNAGSGTPYSNTTTGNQLGRIELAVAPSNPNYIYAQVQSIAPNNNAGCGNAAGCQLGVWASINGGTTWSYMTGSAGAQLAECAASGAGSAGAGSGDYPQNWYDQAVAVDPNDPDRIFVSTFDVWFATRTGTTFYDVTCGYSNVSPKPVHVDQHALAFLPGSSSTLLLGNDGGVHGTTNANAAAPAAARPTWFNMDTGFNTIEFYSGDISGNFATSPNPSANGGAQDNGPSSVMFSGSPTGPAQWQMGLGGDGFYARIDPVGTGPVNSQGLITMTGTGIPVVNETFVIGSQTFTWKATRAGTGDVAIGTSVGTSRNNVVTAVNADLAGVVTATNSGGASALITATTAGAAGDSLTFTEASTNMSMNGTGTLGATTLGAGSLRYWQGNNSGGVSRCITNCTKPGATWTLRRGAWTGDQQSFILPFEIFKGDPSNPSNDCGTAGATTGCGHLVAGTVRVWETILGATNTGTTTNTWYINSPNLTKGTLGNRSFINQLAFEPKDQTVVVVGTNDGAVQIGRNMGTGTANQAIWVNVTDNNAVLPNRPILDVTFDPTTTSAPIAYAAVGGFNDNTPATPGHVMRVVCSTNCATFTWTDKSGNLPDIPVDSIIANPNFPSQVFAGTDFGLYYTDDITAASPIWYRFNAGLPNVMIWDMQIDRGATTLSLWTRSRGAYVWPLPQGPLNPLGTSLAVAPATGSYGGTVNLSATLTSGGNPVAGKSVSFTLNGNSAGSANTDASGVATVLNVSLAGINAGTYPTGVAASFAGDSVYDAANGTGSLTVNPANQTITVNTHAPASAMHGTTFVVAATASSGLPVAYSSSGSCTNSGATYTMTSPTGNCSVMYDQAGNSNYNAAPQVVEVVAAQECTSAVNVARASYGATATASSTVSASFPASGAINGERDGNDWGAGGGWNDATRGVFPDTVEINLGVAQSLIGIDVYTLKNQPNNGQAVNDTTTATSYGVKDFDVQYWTGSAWANVPGGSVTNNTLAKRKFVFAPVTTDRIRVVVNSSNDGLYSRIVELEAFSCAAVVVPTPTPSPTPCATNIATAANGSTAVASSTVNASFPALGVINGEHNGNDWGAGGGWNDGTRGVFPDNIQVNFNATQTINSIAVYTLKNSPNNGQPVNDTTAATSYGVKDFDVQYWTGAAWATVPGGSVTNNTLAKRQFIFAPITTDKIRVVVNSSNDGLYSRIVEVEAFSCGPVAAAYYFSPGVDGSGARGGFAGTLDAFAIRRNDDLFAYGFGRTP